MSAIPGYLTASEAAELIGIDHSQVCRYCQDGRLKATKVGNQWMIKRDDARKFQPHPVGNPTFRKQA
ncbi:MAG: helix-turn-helix domain-containing protein [Pirellulales bacterium]